MKSCLSLFNEINFEPEFLSPCCNIHNIRIPAFPYKGGPIDLQAYGEYMSSVQDELQTETDLCKGCPNLINYTFTHNSLSGLFRAISLNMHRFYCNCKCVYCDLWHHRSKGYGYDPLDGIISLHENRVMEKNCRVHWGGGESSILPFFENTSKWLLENGYLQYIHTNALKFSPTMAKLLRRKMGKLDISLDSSSEEVYRQVKGVDGFKQVLDNLKRYSLEGGPELINLKYIIFDANNDIGEISRFLRIAKSLGIRQIEISLDFRDINNNRVSDKTISAAAFMEIQAQAMGFDFMRFYPDKILSDKIDKAIAQIK